MYKMQPILTNVELESPTCMYGMKSIYADFDCRNTADIGNALLTTATVPGVSEKHSSTKPKPLDILQQIDKYLKGKEGDDLNVIAERQQNILTQLKCLEDKLKSMRLELGVCTKGTPHSPSSNYQNTKVTNNQPTKKTINESLLQEIVINANPCNIPFSLLAIKNIWKQQELINVNIHCFTHSSIVELSMDAKVFTEKLMNSVDNQQNTVLPTMNVTLIWKNVECIEMLCPITNFQPPIWGECNLLRYLSRIGPSEFCYEMQSQCNDTDILLDLCYELLIVWKNVKDRQKLVGTLSGKLGKQLFFGGGGDDSWNVSDIAVSSTIKQIPSIMLKDFPPNINKWLDKCESIFYY